jgi:enoyl-CoA hydratase/carnithine racemase
VSGPSSITEVDAGDGRLRWELCRPKRRNAIDPEGLRWIEKRCRELDGHTVVLTGQGTEAFCAGFDLDALAEHRGEGPPDQPLIDAAAAMRAANATFIARIGGYVIGAGVELVCACDLRIARRGVHFSVPATRLGVVYHPDGMQLLHAVFGPALSRHLLLLGRRVTAAQAERVGAVTELVEADELDAAVDRAVHNLAGGSSRALAAHRSMLRQLDVGGPTQAQRQDYQRLREEAYAALDPAGAKDRLIRG